MAAYDIDVVCAILSNLTQAHLASFCAGSADSKGGDGAPLLCAGARTRRHRLRRTALEAIDSGWQSGDSACWLCALLLAVWASAMWHSHDGGIRATAVWL